MVTVFRSSATARWLAADLGSPSMTVEPTVVRRLTMVDCR